jgi:hypothetical protein
LQIIAAVISLLLAYLMPGMSISFLLFPYRRGLTVVGRMALAVGLSSSLVAFSMLASDWIFGRFDTLFVMVILSLFTICPLLLSRLIYRRAHKEGFSDSVSEAKYHDARGALPGHLLWLFVLGTVFIVFFRFYNGLLFPITNWDSLTEFAYLGRLYFEEGRIPLLFGATLGIGSSANYPPLVPLLYTWFYTMTGEVTEVLARAVSPIFSLMTAIVTYSLANTMYKSKGLAKSALFFLTTVPVFMFVSEECLSDIVTAFFHLSSIYFLYMSLEKDQPGSRRLMFVAGLMAGASAFTKYDGLVSLIIGWALIILYKHLDRNRVGLALRTMKLGDLKPLLVFSAGFMVFGAPWYVRNLVLLGNPVYPLLYRIFGGKGIDAWVMANSWDAHFSLVAAQNHLDLSPISLFSTYFTVFFRISPYELLDLGPLLGAFVAIGLVFALRKKQPADLFLLVWSFSFLVMWRFAFGTFLRYLAIILPALAIISARGLTSLYNDMDSLLGNIPVPRLLPKTLTISKGGGLRILVFMLLFEAFLLPSAINGLRGYKTWAFTGPMVSGEDYLRTRFQGTWDAIEFLNSTPANTTILTYDHSLPYYVERPFVFLDESRAKGLHQALSDAEVSAVLGTLKISLVVTNTATEEYFPLLKESYFYQRLNNSSYAKLIMDHYPSRVYSVTL